MPFSSNLANCSGGTGGVSRVMNNNGKTVNGMGVVVCDVPNTSGPITRNKTNCRGDFADVWLHSGQRYSSFQTSGAQNPSGVQVFRI